MRRRRFLGLLTASLTVGTGGCLASPPEAGPGVSGPAPTPTLGEAGRQEPPVRTVAGADLPIGLSEMRAPLPRDYIPAIVEPAFATDWSGLDAGKDDPALPDDAPIIGVERGGRARAYPLRILEHHEVVNDCLAGPIAVTYCVLCGSGVVFERRVAGEPARFGVSGKLWRSDLVMYDGLTDSLWSQLAATAIRGTRTGEELTLLPSTLTTWAAWRGTHPETQVLLPPPRSGTVDRYDRAFDYFIPKYGDGSESQLVGRDTHDGDLHPKTMVIGVSDSEVARAYPFDIVTARDVINDRVGELPLVVAASPDDTLVAYDRRIEGYTHHFEEDGDRHLLADGSRWDRTSGQAVDGPHAGRQLARANDHPPMFWTGWSEFNPGTEVYGTESAT